MHFPKLNGYLSDFLHESELDKKSASSVQNSVTNDVKFMSEKFFSHFLTLKTKMRRYENQ